MRFLLVAAIWLVLVGGLSLYTWQRDRLKPPPLAAETVTGVSPELYALEVTPEFTTAGDPFALRGDSAESATLLVRTANRELFRSDQPVAAGMTQSVHPLPGLVLGRNEIYVRAVPPLDEQQDHALRVRILQGEKVLLDQTVRGEKGAVVAGTLSFELKEKGEGSHER